MFLQLRCVALVFALFQLQGLQSAQILQTSITYPVLQVPIGGLLTVTTGVQSPTALTAPGGYSVMAEVEASNGANTGIQILLSSLAANTPQNILVNFTISTTAGLSVGPAYISIQLYQNNPWTQITNSGPIPFYLTAAAATTTTTPPPTTTTTTTKPTTTTTTTTTTKPTTTTTTTTTTKPTTTTTTTHPTTTTTTTTTTASGPAILFQDNFNTLSIAGPSNPTGNWQPDDFSWQSETQGYQDFAGTNWNLNPNDPTTSPYTAFTVSSGILTISSFRTPAAIDSAIATEKANQGVSGGVPAWCGGMMVSRLSFTEGYYEIRAQWPNSGKGMFPALWLYAAPVTPDNKGGAEIDVLEMFGAPNTINTGLHMLYNNNTGSNVALGSQTIDTTQWHTFGLDRQPGWLRFYLDGTLIYQVTGANASWYTGVPMCVRMNYAMDAPWFGSLLSDSTTPSPLLMNVDYVTIWATKP